MAIIKKHNPNIVYMSERLEKRLDTLTEYPLTIAEAPTGYGKSTTIREYLNKNNIQYIWFNVDTDDKDKFFNDFATRIKSVSEECCHNLLSIGYPTNAQASGKIAQALMNIDFRETTVLIIDNYHLISDEFTNMVIMDLSGNDYSKLKVVCLTQAVTSRLTLELVLKKKLNYIGKEDFELTRPEIAEYYKLCGIKLDDDETDFLYKYTEGWVSALYLQMLSYVSTNSFEPTVSIDNLVGKAIWDNLTAFEQDFLICMSVFESFTVRQAIYVYDNKITEEEILNLINKSGFIKFDSKTRKYYIHTILMYFLENEFEKLEPVFKKKIFKGAGNWCKVNENYFEAICYYYRIKDYDSIMDMEINLSVFNGINNKQYKNMILDIVEKTPKQTKKKHLKTYLVFLFFLFVYNKRDMLAAECENILNILVTDEFDPDEKAVIEGNLYCLLGIKSYNILSEMYDYYDKGYKLLKEPSDIFSSVGSCTLLCPSVLGMYHRTEGSLNEEMTALERFMPLYYKITDGCGKGQDAVMKAEALFMQGNFEDALKLCNKAVYMSETRNELSIYFCAKLILARIAFFMADYGKLNDIIDNITKKIEDNERYDLVAMSDLCIGYIRILLNESSDIAGWLKSGETIEENCTIHNLGFANLIYGRYLLYKEEYDMFESLAGQMMSVTDIYSNILYKIYICIYLSIAKFAKKDVEKSKKLMCEAIDYAKPDGLIIPFIENVMSISEILSCIELSSEYRDFVKEIKSYAKKYSGSFRTVIKASKSEHSFGLTNRELEVAKLAAQRLSNKEIADVLFIAESTVKSNLKIIFSKLGINSRNDLKNFFK